MIAALTSLTALTVTTEGCSASAQPVVSDVINCATAEADAIASGFSVMQIVDAVWSAIETIDSGPSAVLAAVVKLIEIYGSEIVACAIDNYPEPGSGSGSAAPAPALASVSTVSNKRMLLSTLFAGKKIAHNFKKK